MASLAGAVVAGSTLVGVGTSAAASGGGTEAITTVVGGGATTAITNGIPSLSASLGSPIDAVFDAHGNVVFADQDNNVIRVAAASTGTFWGHAMTAGHIYTIVGNGIDGDIGDGSSNPAHHGGALRSQRRRRRRARRPGHHRLRQRRRPIRGGRRGFRYGQQMAAGKIYTIAGGGQEGDITPGGSTFSAGLTSPDGVAFDAQGDVIVADTGNDLIRLIPAVARTVFARPSNPGASTRSPAT